MMKWAFTNPPKSLGTFTLVQGSEGELLPEYLTG
jgi:hypothetical protein